MKERPILFSGEMVRAILDGRKTQTRRVIKRRDGEVPLDFYDGMFWFADGDAFEMRCPYGVPEDRLWVREKCKYAGYSGQGLIMGEACGAWDTWAVGTKLVPDPFWDFREKYSDRWCPSIFMPRWASRITLEITDVRVQRVQEISEEDARAEGAMFHDGRGIGHSGWRFDIDHGFVYSTSKTSFMKLWDSINAKRGFGWDKNRWVWALTFRRVQ